MEVENDIVFRKHLRVCKKCNRYPLTSQLDLQNLSYRITYAHAQRYMYMDVHCSLVIIPKRVISKCSFIG